MINHYYSLHHLSKCWDAFVNSYTFKIDATNVIYYLKHDGSIYPLCNPDSHVFGGNTLTCNSMYLYMIEHE